MVDPKSRFSAPKFHPQLLMGNGKSDIGSFADCILKKSSHLSTYRRRRLLFRQMNAERSSEGTPRLPLIKWIVNLLFSDE
jgi:hypothetical protein